MGIPLSGYGRSTILLGTALLLAGAVLGLLFFWPAAVLFGLLWVALLAFFRDPERSVQSPPHALLSPADGVVRDVGEVEPPGFIEGRAVRVGIFMSLFDVHVNRSPAAGTVRWVSHHPGSFHDARSEAAAAHNEHNLLGLGLEDGRRILVNQVAGLIARRIVCRASVGDVLKKGQRFGMVKFGSRVELYLPLADQYSVAVRPGDRVKAGQSVLATWRGRRTAPATDQVPQAAAEDAKQS